MFQKPSSRTHLRFVHRQLKDFSETVLKLESQRTTAVDVAIILTELKLNLHEKKNGEMKARVFLNEIKYFHEKGESHMDVYRDAYEGVTHHLWMNSSIDLSSSLVGRLRKKSATCLRKK